MGGKHLFFNNSHASLLYYNNILSCRKQRRKQQQSQQPRQTVNPLELEFLLRDVLSEVSNPYCSTLLCMSLDQRSPAIPTQLENLCGLLPQGSRRGKRRNSCMMLQTAESFELDCHCVKASKAPCYLTIHVGLKRAQFYGMLTNFQSP